MSESSYATDKLKVSISLKKDEIEKLEKQILIAKQELEILEKQSVCDHEYGESEHWEQIAFRVQCKKCGFYNFHT
jgi:hypothetical protein